MKVSEILELLKHDGWYVARMRGSHRQFKHPAKAGLVTVAGKPGDDFAKQYSQAGWPQEMRNCFMRYAVVIEDAGANFSAYVPDLPGCVATGSTVAETEQAIREAIALHLEGLREAGSPIPPALSQVEYVEVAA
jgi:predicted RNase H-like HicB family nuclease/predicted RNA binding protein YcfA (HicA-like mRNA interferase family)